MWLFRVSYVKESHVSGTTKEALWESLLSVMITFWTIFLYNKTFTTLLTLVVLYIRVYIPYVVCTLLLIPLRVFSVKRALFSLTLPFFLSLFSSSASFHIDVVMLSGGGFVVLFAFWNVVLIFGRGRGEGWGDGGSNHLGAADQDALALSFRERF